MFKTSSRRLKMEKTPRYTQRERNMVLGYAARHKDIIENKRTDAESNRKKDEVWLQIAKEFNIRAYHQRSAKQLRQLYKNMKLLLKKDLSGEDRGNRSFMELLNTLASQDSVTQYITEQMSPDSGGGVSYSGLGGGGGSGAGDGRSGMHDDYDDSKMHFDDTDVILIKSETISDNEQDNGLHGMDDDDDDDCLSPKAPEVCLEEEDEELFATDLRQLNQHNSNSNGSSRQTSTPSGLNCQLANAAAAAATLLPLSQSTTPNSMKTTPTPMTTLTLATLAAGTLPSASTAATAPTTNGATTTLFGNAKPEITVQNVGGIRVGAFASLSKTLQNGAANSLLTIQSANSPGSTGLGSNASSGVGSGSSSTTQQQLTPEQVQQHLLLNGLGLSAVHPPASILPALNNATTAAATNTTTSGQHSPNTLNNNNNNNNNQTSSASATTTTALPIGRHTRSSDPFQLNAIVGNNNNNNNSHSLPNGKHMLLNGHGSKSIFNSNYHHQYQQQQQQRHHQQQQQQQHHHHHHHQQQQQQQFNNSLNHSGSSNSTTTTTTTAATTKSQQNEYLMKLTIEERERKIALLNAQIDYWKTLTKKLDTNSGHFPTPSCLCHFPGNPAGNAAAAAANGMQSQASSS